MSSNLTFSAIFIFKKDRYRTAAVIQFFRRYAGACPPFMKELLTLVRMGAAGEDYPEQDTSHFSVVSFQMMSFKLSAGEVK